MANPLITELEAMVLWAVLTLIRALVLMGFFLRSSKPLTPTFPLYLPEYAIFHFKLSRSLKICVAQ